MGEKFILNSSLMNWIFDVIKDMIESTYDDNPEKIKTIIAANNFINQLGMSDPIIADLFGEDIKDNILNEE